MVAPVRTRAEFAALSRARRRRAGPVWIAHASHVVAGADDEIRVAYAVSRQVGTAVVRNRTRRRLRAVMRDLARDGGLVAGLYLVGVRPAVVSLGFGELRCRVVEALPSRS